MYVRIPHHPPISPKQAWVHNHIFPVSVRNLPIAKHRKPTQTRIIKKRHSSSCLTGLPQAQMMSSGWHLFFSLFCGPLPSPALFLLALELIFSHSRPVTSLHRGVRQRWPKVTLGWHQLSLVNAEERISHTTYTKNKQTNKPRRLTWYRCRSMIGQYKVKVTCRHMYLVLDISVKPPKQGNLTERECCTQRRKE